MTSPRLGFILLSLALVSPRLIGGDSPSIAAAEEYRTTSTPDNLLTARNIPTFNLSTSPITFARGETSGEAQSRSIIRNALRESFPYDPNARTKSAVSSSAGLAEGTLGPEVVVMQKLEIKSRPLDRGLPEAIARWKSPDPQNHSRFGTGIHQKDYGKVRASVVTILYIPVLFGLSW